MPKTIFFRYYSRATTNERCFLLLPESSSGVKGRRRRSSNSSSILLSCLVISSVDVCVSSVLGRMNHPDRQKHKKHLLTTKQRESNARNFKRKDKKEWNELYLNTAICRRRHTIRLEFSPFISATFCAAESEERKRNGTIYISSSL